MDTSEVSMNVKSKKGGILTYDLYRIFQQYLRNGCSKIPDTNLLLDLVDGPVTTTEKRKRLRKKFKSWAARMDARPSDGRLVYKSTGKLIIPEEYFFTIVKKKHCGNGAKHLNLTQTFEAVMREYSVGKREFGIDRDLIVAIVNNCPDPECRRASFWRQLPKNQPRYSGQQTGENLLKSQQKFIYHIPDQTLLHPDCKTSEHRSYESSFKSEPENVKKVKLDGVNCFTFENTESKGNNNNTTDTKGANMCYQQYNMQRYPRCIYTTASNSQSLNHYTSSDMRPYPPQNVNGDDDDVQPLNLVIKDRSENCKKPATTASSACSASGNSELKFGGKNLQEGSSKSNDNEEMILIKNCGSGSGCQEDRGFRDSKSSIEEHRPPSPRYHYFTRSSSTNSKKLISTQNYPDCPASSSNKSPSCIKTREFAKIALSEFSKLNLPFKQHCANLQNSARKNSITHYPIILPKLKPEHIQFYSDPSYPGQIFFKASREMADKNRQQLPAKQFGSGDASAFRKPERMKQIPGPPVPLIQDPKIGLSSFFAGPSGKLADATPKPNDQSIEKAVELDENSLNDFKIGCKAEVLNYAKKINAKIPLHKTLVAAAKSKSFQPLSAKEQFFLAQKSNITALKHRLALEKSLAKKLQRSKKFRQMLQRKQVHAKIDELYLLLLKRIHMLGRRLRPSVATVTARSQECLKNYINDCISLIYNIRKEVPEIHDDHWAEMRKKYPPVSKPPSAEPTMSKPKQTV